MPAKKTTARELLFGDLWEFDPAPESAPAHIEPRYGLFIGGKMTAPKSRKYFDSISPRDGKKLSAIALANAADVDAAYQSAAKAFKTWGKLPGAERGKYLFRIARLLQDRSREFAVA
ncbi:MAG TPA: aldehyde dehydrogenase family protein, partial [Luteolibacter sp.]|nr:aldehyde dehydrogenase family protein [Luteolibacter sp.]